MTHPQAFQSLHHVPIAPQVEHHQAPPPRIAPVQSDSDSEPVTNSFITLVWRFLNMAGRDAKSLPLFVQPSLDLCFVALDKISVFSPLVEHTQPVLLFCSEAVVFVLADCLLLELPTHLLYKVTQSLDLASQRSLFLSSSQLYSRWNLHVPADNRNWQFVKQSTELLAEGMPDLGCSADSNISVHFEQGALWAKITCQRQPQSNSLRFDLTQNTSCHPDLTKDAKYCSALTQEQLWHRLVASPKLAFATVTLTTANLATQLQQKAFAKQCFHFLCTTRGLLTFFLSELEESHPDASPGHHAVKVLHAVRKGKEYWEIDGERSIISPPKFDFDNMPGCVESVHAQFVSEGPPAQAFLSPKNPEALFFPDSQPINDFFYQENVDIDAWVDEQHDVAENWYAHMDDSMEGFDDMNDLDDAAMAQLLGAMQG